MKQLQKNIIFIVFMFFCVGCQTYTSSNKEIREKVYSNKVDEALTLLDKSSLADEERNYSLYRMEKGMMLYLLENYSDSTPLWSESDRHLDNLYTTSISKTAASFVVNDTLTDYEGEAHERILLPIFTSVAFFLQSDYDNSLAMIRRTNDVIAQLKNQESKLIKMDSFSHYFSAFMYENAGEWDNAIVEYRKSLRNIIDQAKLTHKNLSESRSEIVKALGRLANYRGRDDILKEIKEYRSGVRWQSQEEISGKSEVLIVYESGLSPIKVPKDIVAPGPSLKTVVRVSFPVYNKVAYKSHKSFVAVNGKKLGSTVLMEDIGAMAEQALSERRSRDIPKLVARVVAKELAAKSLSDNNPLAGVAASLYNVATEVADTRSWTTLPDTIQVARVVIEPNQPTKITVTPESGAARTFDVNLMPGEKRLYRFRTFN